FPSPCGLLDSHISEAPTMLDGVELREASEHDDWAGLSVIAGPAAEPCADARRIGERAYGMRIFLLFGLAFEAVRDARQSGFVVGIEDVAERTFGFSLALGDELHHLDRSNENGRHQLFERAVLLLPQGFDGEALRLHRPEQLLDRPAQPIEADDAARVGDVIDLMGGEQEPQRRLFALRRIDLAADDEPHLYGLGQAVGGFAVFG